jgi:hypothetical protein
LSPQESVNRFALLAKPRIDSLMRMQSVAHIYDMNPGRLHDRTTFDGITLIASRFKQALQPYRDLTAFTTDERIMPHIIDAGLVPIVKALLQEARGQQYLLTRNIAAQAVGASAYIEGIGVRIRMYTDEDAGDTIIAWESLYGAGTPRKV